MYVEVIGLLVGVGSLILPCKSQGWKLRTLGLAANAFTSQANLLAQPVSQLS